MEQLVTLWMAMDARRRAVAAISTLSMFAGILFLARLAAEPNLSLLYAGLEPGPAGEVIQALEQDAVTYEVRGGAIFVDETRRDELRLRLAANGLPAQSSRGYELLDTLTGFGTTAQMFDAAYWRAKEGELARTIVSSPLYRSARVHVSTAAAQPFRRAGAASASVTVAAASGTIAAAQARALRHLVASAVAGLAPADVSVIDALNGTVIADDDPADPGLAGGDRAEQLAANVRRLLEARVGPGNAIVEVNVETVTEQESITERRFDPEGRVAISSETEERSTSSNDSTGGSVTVASNLPEGDAAAGDNTSSSQNSETRERLNYEVSETTREILKAPGAVRRVTAAVLVNEASSVDPDTGEVTWTPRPADELAALQELVASAVGFDQSRGDSLTIKSMRFEPAATLAVEPAPAPPLFGLNIMKLIQVAVAGLVTLALGLFVVRPVLARPVGQLPAPASPASARLAPPEAPAAVAPTVLEGEIDPADGPAPVGRDIVAGAAAGAAANALARTEPALDPAERLRNLIENRHDETVRILGNWIAETKENA